MIAFKGFTKDLKSVMGDGKKETCYFHPGETKEVETSKTGRNGFHCCENPFECLTYYALNGNNRFFRVEAAGDINEDASGRIACTRITLLEELSDMALAVAEMQYIINHPHRSDWEQRHYNVVVQKDTAEITGQGIAIARGKRPRVRGAEGAILGLLVDGNKGIRECKLFRVHAGQAGKWYRLTETRELEEVADEETED